MNILIIGSNGREHALAVSYAKSKKVNKVIMTPGNGLTDFTRPERSRRGKIKNYPDVGMMDLEGIVQVCKKEKIDLVDVAQDDIIAAGYVDKLEKLGIKAFGPTQKASQIEWDKEWARNFMVKYGLPIPRFVSFNDKEKAIDYINRLYKSSHPEFISGSHEMPKQVRHDNLVVYIKASGLAAGKGAIRAENRKQAIGAIEAMTQFGKSGETFLIEEALVGEEFSLFAICDGSDYQVVSWAQDHKTVFDGDQGPNTGGMGCVAPAGVLNNSIVQVIGDKILKPFIRGMQKESRPYRGVIYLGGMLTNPPAGGGVKIIEFNARWGDPEAEVILPGVKTDYLDIVEAVLSGKLKRLKLALDKKVRISIAGCSRGYPGDYSKVKGKEIFGLNEVIKIPGVIIFGAGIKRKGIKFFANGGRVFHLVAEGKDVLEAREKAYQAMKLISIEGDNLHYRTDIGWRDIERMRNPERTCGESLDFARDKLRRTSRRMDRLIQTVRVRTNNEDTARVYRLEGINEKQAKVLAEKLFCEDINQTYTINKPIFRSAVEIAYKPGVMNPEVASIVKAASDLGIKLLAADSSREYLNKAPVFNPLIEYIVKKPPKTLLVKGKIGKTENVPIRKLSDEQLMKLSQDRLFLNIQEMKIIKNFFTKINRDPTDCEIEVLAQTWSEHCVHKTFKAKLIVDGKVKEPLISRIKKTAQNNKKLIVSAFVDNSGVIDFYDGMAVNGKVETHNAPSAIEPYGGAMTGSGGVFRDILGTGQGAKPIISTDIFCFAPPNLSPKLLPSGCLTPEYILRRVIAGVRDYGNRVGIPTNNGSIHFHPDFRAKPTVAVGSFGIMPKKQAKKQGLKVGDLICSIGGRTGRDGIHGATFSSGEMTERTKEVSGSAVQIGNAIEEKRMIDAILAMRDQNLIRTITDCGAGGYSSAVGEMGQKTGARVFLEKVPLKYTGLAPWEIFLSESQERMVLAIAPKNLAKVQKIARLYNVEISVIGHFDNSHRLKVTYGKQIVCDLPMDFLHHGLPQRVMRATVPLANVKVRPSQRSHLVNCPKTEKEWISIFEKILAHGNVCSKEPIVRLYDHNVQGTSALHPFGGVNFDGPNDGTIVKPILSKPYGIVVTHGLNPVLNKIDPYWGSVWALTEAVSNFTAVGGNLADAALVDNFIWPFPDEESLWNLDRAVDACCRIANLLKMPFVSGKDSLGSTFRGPDGLVIKIPPVVLISVFGKIPDVRKTVSSDFKKAGSTIVLVGKQDLEGMAGSTYFEILENPHLEGVDKQHLRGGPLRPPSREADSEASPDSSKVGSIPKVDLKLLSKVLNTIYQSIQTGKILSCHDISEGGLATALFEMCLGGGMGADPHLEGVDKQHLRGGLKDSSKVNHPDYLLFNETPGCFVLEVENENIAKKLFEGVPYQVLGKTQPEKIIRVDKLFEVNVDQLAKAWKRPMEEIF